MNAHTPNQIEPFKLGKGRPLSAMVQEMIAKEMMRGIPRHLRQRPWPTQRGQKPRPIEDLEPEILRLHAEGMCVYKICRAMSLPSMEVRDVLRAAGRDVGRTIIRRGGAVEIGPRAAQLYASGMTAQQIGDELKVNEKTVRRALRMAGVEMSRTRGRAAANAAKERAFYSTDNSAAVAVVLENRALRRDGLAPEVLRLRAAGRSQDRIAAALDISRGTVKRILNEHGAA